MRAPSIPARLPLPRLPLPRLGLPRLALPLLAVPLLAVPLLLAACSPAPRASGPQASGPQAAERAATLKPADPHLAGLYASACHACHGQPGSGAPLAGDRAAWDPRWAKGMPALMTSVVSGYRGMPAGGQCFACTPQDYQGLIRFMAGRGAPAAN